MKKFIAQFIFNRLVKSNKNSLFGKIIYKIFFSLRKRMVKKKDSLIKFKLYDKLIELPLSHDLPINKKFFPLYSDNIRRISEYLKKRYKKLHIIDIGANVGDTAYIINSKIDANILCIEGDKRYFSILQKNIEGMKNIFCENSFIGDKDFVSGTYEIYEGSGRIVKDEIAGKKIEFVKLSDVLNKQPKFKKSKLLKIDTDGYDNKIIKSELKLLKEMKPVIFFEYDPYLLERAGENGLDVFRALNKIGYRNLIFYLNTGEYLLMTECNQIEVLEDLHNHFSGKKGICYYDICAFHKDDSELAKIIRNCEIEFQKSL